MMNYNESDWKNDEWDAFLFIVARTGVDIVLAFALLLLAYASPYTGHIIIWPLFHVVILAISKFTKNFERIKIIELYARIAIFLVGVPLVTLILYAYEPIHF